MGRWASLKAAFERQCDRLERNRLVGFLLATRRRFQKIGGKHLSLVICLNLFVAVIPLLIIGYAFLEAFNPNRSIGGVLVGRFHLTGETADTVRSTFATAQAGKSVALSIGLISLLITGVDIAATVSTAYARAFELVGPTGWRKYLRGWTWLVVLLVMTSLSLTVRYWADSRPWWFLLVCAPLAFAATLSFYWVTPRLLLDLPFSWRDLFPGALACALMAAALSTASTFVLGQWFAWYGHAYGAFGIALALISWVGILSLFWVWIAAAQGVYWERRANAFNALVVDHASEERSETSGRSLGPTEPYLD